MRSISYICGLGNPGSEYKDTRHNLGFETLDLIASRIGSSWIVERGSVAYARGAIEGKEIILLKPLAYMNLSGTVLDRFKSLSEDNLLVICDDINLPFGSIRIRLSGGSGGHKGLESVERHFDSNDFARLRMGIGPAPDPGRWSDFVLEKFTDKELTKVGGMVREAAEAVETAVSAGVGLAMQEFNGKR